MTKQVRPDYDITATTKLDERALRDLDDWADRNYSDRSKVLRAIIMTVLEQIKEQRAFDEPLGNLIQRIKLEPKHGKS